MSIYFQYPAIDDYPNLTLPVNTTEEVWSDFNLSSDIKDEQAIELQNYLTLKQV